jgi:hypothetical protein
LKKDIYKSLDYLFEGTDLQYSTGQWGDELVVGILYDKMKEKDNKILIISNGDIWQGLEHYSKMDSISNGKFDLYGYHPGMGIDTNVVNSGQDTSKMGYLGLPLVFENYSLNLRNLIKERGKNHTIGITEWSHFLLNIPINYNDLTDFTSQFQNGLYNSLMINFHLRNSDFIKMNEKTAHIGSIQRRILENGKRLIYPKPPVIVSEMIRNHIGDMVLETESFSFKYNAFGYEKMIWVYDVPYTDFTVTATNDSVFINIVNRHLYDSVKVNLNSNLYFNGEKGKIYTYYQENLEAMLLPDNLNAFDPTMKEVPITNEYYFPPHSFSILALPTIETLNTKINGNIYINHIVTDGFLRTNIIDKIVSIEIYSLNGNVIDNYNLIQSQPITIDVSEFSLGVYFYLFKTENETYKGKFLKSK